MLETMLDKFNSLLRALGFKKHPPLTNELDLKDFISSRAAFVSQVTLYTYVKARSGMQHVKLFENSQFLVSLKIARWHIFGTAVADLALFSTAQMVKSDALSEDEGRQFAKRLMHSILHDYDQQDIEKSEFDAMLKRGQRRAEIADWTFIVDGAAAFQASSDAVFRWAPIADELKNNDEEIVRNSIHLRWIGVRRDVKELIRPAEIAASIEFPK